MDILDPELIAQLAAGITATMQFVKSNARVKGSDIPYLSGIVGAIVGVLYFMVNGDLNGVHSLWGVDWSNAFRGAFNGIIAAVSSNGVYNLQKVLPIPNLLPTAGEMDEHKLKEELAAKARNEVAIAEGVEKPAPSSPPPAVVVPAETPAEETPAVG